MRKLVAGQIGVEEYLDDRVEKALARLGRWVSEDERETLRDVVRAHAATDPVIQEYVRRAMTSNQASDPSAKVAPDAPPGSKP